MKLEGEPRVLLVEDVAALQQLVGTILRRAGAKVTIAENGLEGVEAARSSQFDVVLMDMQMPVMDGYTAASLLRSEGISTPVFAMTAHATEADEAKCIQAGCTGFLSKPVKPDVLIATIANFIADAPGGVVADAMCYEQRQTTDVSAADNSDTIDREELLERVLHDVELLESVFDVFFEDYPELFMRIEAAIKSENPDELMKSAHTLKSALVNLSATQAHQSAHSLEQLGESGSTKGADKLAAQLDFQIEELKAAYKELADSLNGTATTSSVAK